MPTPAPRFDLPKLAAPAQRALASLNIKGLNDLTQYTETEISRLHGMGPNALKTLKQAMAELGITFKPN